MSPVRLGPPRPAPAGRLDRVNRRGIVPPAMINRQSAAVVGILTVGTLVAGLGWPLRADDLPAEAEEQVLILANESVLVGHIKREGNAYRVRRGAGETVIPADRVLRLCANRAEAYAYLRGRANLRDPDERLRLARWCMQHGLREQARAEADEALRLRPTAQEAQRLVRALAAPPRLASAAAPAAPASRPPPNPSAAEVDCGPEVLQDFTLRVQPILMNSCGTGACHGRADHAGYTLVRPPPPGTFTAPLTRQNLARTLAWVDPDDSANSPLLRKALETLGGAAGPPLASKAATPSRTLEAWVLKAIPPRRLDLTPPPSEPTPNPPPQGEPARPPDSAGPPPPAPAAPAPALAPGTHTLRVEPPLGPRLPVGPRRSDKPAERPPFPGGEVVGSSRHDVKPSPPKPRAETKPAKPPAPVDPFDPAIFNHLIHRGKPPPRDSTTIGEREPANRE